MLFGHCKIQIRLGQCWNNREKFNFVHSRERQKERKKDPTDDKVMRCVGVNLISQNLLWQNSFKFIEMEWPAPTARSSRLQSPTVRDIFSPPSVLNWPAFVGSRGWVVWWRGQAIIILNLFRVPNTWLTLYRSTGEIIRTTTAEDCPFMALEEAQS